MFLSPLFRVPLLGALMVSVAIAARPVGAQMTAQDLSATKMAPAVGEVGSLVVNRADDVSAADNQTTLREAIAYAGTLSGTPTITFDPAVFGTAKTITLASGHLILNSNVIIQGPVAAPLTLDANNASRIFLMTGGTVEIHKITITGGRIGGGGYSAGVGDGAGIRQNAGTLTLEGCTITNNTVVAGFGGAMIRYGGNTILRNCTISGNQAGDATSPGDGGGLDFEVGSTTLSNCTIVNNSAISYGTTSSYGGGIYNNAKASCTLDNTLIASNMAANSPDIYGSVISTGHNLIGNNSGSSGVTQGTNSDLVGNSSSPLNPRIGALSNNGGPTFTHALLAGSPAINAGNSTLATDQRGVARVSLPDIGAYEASNAPVVVSVSPDNASDNVGASRTFSLSVKDEDGLSDIREVWLMANTQLDWSQGATFVYVRASNQLYLRDGDHFNGPITPGSGTLSNGAVSVEGSSVTVTPGADTKTLGLSLTLQTKNGIIGANTLWGRVQDNEDAVDPASLAGQFGFVNKGSWMVLAQYAPSVTVTPGSKNTSTSLTVGSEFNFTLDLAGPNGASTLSSAYILINSPGNLDWSNGFTLVYASSTNRLYLRKTDGSDFLGGGVIGQSSGTLENDAGSVRLDGCSVTPITNGVRLVLPVTFKNAFAGTRQVWTRAEDKAGTVASDSDTPLGFKTEGLLVISGTNQATPQASVSVAGTGAGKGTTTSLTSGTETTFTLNLSDADGASDLASAYILINSPGNLDWSNGFTLVYAPSTNRLYLRKTDGSDFLGGNVIGQSSGTLENEAGSVRLDGCSVRRTATGIVLSLAVTPKAAFAGTRQLWSRVEDNSGNVQVGHDAQLGFNTEGQLQIATPSSPSSSHFSPSAPVS